MKYSFNGEKSKITFGSTKDINASYKDLSAVCSSIRYKTYAEAMRILKNISKGMPIVYRKHNKGMGSRHALGGRKGRTPIRCSKFVTKALINAVNNAKNKGMSEDELIVVHAAANKTFTAPRRPPRGRQQGSPYGRYGYNTMAHSDLEFSKIEIGVSSEPENIKISKDSLKKIERNKKKEPKNTKITSKKETKKKPKHKMHPLQKGQVKPKTEEAQNEDNSGTQTAEKEDNK